MDSFKTPGFISSLIQIINNNIHLCCDNTVDHLITSALSQMKNMFRKLWRIKNPNYISIEDRTNFIQSVIPLNVAFFRVQNSQQSYRYMKLMKDIVKEAASDVIFIAPELLEVIKQYERSLEVFPIILNIVSGISH